MMLILECLPSLKAAPGETSNKDMHIKYLISILLLFFSQYGHAENNFINKFEQQFCTYGSHKQLYRFFTKENFIVFAQAKRKHSNRKIKDFADVLFLISPDMKYFHAVTLHGIKYDHFKACVFTSAREVDYQFSSPIPGIMQRINREHKIFLIEDMPSDSQCPANSSNCIPWSKWSKDLNDVFLLSAYAYSTKQSTDPYNEIVDLTLDGKTIQPTRGKLTQHARQKYAMRLRNELNESEEDSEAAKTVYRNIFNEVDHNLPLMQLKLTDDRQWSISEIDRETGLVWIILEGVELELYPMQNDQYKAFLN